MSGAQTHHRFGAVKNAIAALQLSVIAPQHIRYTVEINGPRANVNDVATFWLNRNGAPTKIQDGHGHLTEIIYDTNHTLLPVRVRSPDGRVQRFRYDGSARLVVAEDSTHSAGRDSVMYAYESPHAPSEPTLISLPRSAGVRDNTLYYYNPLGLPDSIVDARGHKTGYAYNTRGQVESVTEYNVPVWQTAGAAPTLQNVVTNLRYGNNLANLDTTITPLGHTTRLLHDAAGRVRQVIDATGDSVKYTYHAMNWPSTVVQFDSSMVGNPLQAKTTSMGYNADGARISLIDPRGVTRSWEHDALGRDTVMMDEFGRKEFRRYDLAGNLIVLKNRQGDSIKTAYDALGRDTLRSIGQIRIDAGETAYYGNSIGTVAIAAD
ncbi:MAG: hypothetical protein ACRENP_21860, partial [Longimicrobiales bacterium]